MVLDFLVENSFATEPGPSQLQKHKVTVGYTFKMDLTDNNTSLISYNTFLLTLFRGYEEKVMVDTHSSLYCVYSVSFDTTLLQFLIIVIHLICGQYCTFRRNTPKTWEIKM